MTLPLSLNSPIKIKMHRYGSLKEHKIISGKNAISALLVHFIEKRMNSHILDFVKMKEVV